MNQIVFWKSNLLSVRQLFTNYLNSSKSIHFYNNYWFGSVQYSMDCMGAFSPMEANYLILY